MRQWREDGGTGSVLAVALISVVALAATTVGLGTAAVSARSHGQGAADLAALAAAAGARDLRALGTLDGTAHVNSVARERVCDVAREVAHRNNTAVVGCTVAARGVVTVHVESARGPWAIVSLARAGSPRERRGQEKRGRREKPDGGTG